MDEIVNKVSNSKIITFDMEEVLPKQDEVMTFDIGDHLFQGMVLREKDFRQTLKEYDWSIYKDKHVIVTCTVDAVVQIWAYMLVSSYLTGIAKNYAQNIESLYLDELQKSINQLKIDFTDLHERPIVIKGCSNIPHKETLYLESTKAFLPFAKSIMYGEPCSMVPIYKKKR